jgi:predicted RND superfamily exporter protein
MRDKLLKILTQFHVKHPWRMLSATVLITLLFALFASNLKHTMRWSDLLPSKDRRTIQFNKVINEFTSATSIVVVVQGEEKDIKAFADAAAPRIRQIYDLSDNTSFIKRVDYKLETEFLKKHGVMLIKKDDLLTTKDVFKNPSLAPLLMNINNSMEKEYIQREDSMSTREKEDSAFRFLDGIENFVNTMRSFINGNGNNELAIGAVDKLLFGEQYMLSYDKSALILNVIPNFTMMDIGKVISGTIAVQKIVDDIKKEFPNVEAGLTGMVPLAHDEMVYSEQSLGYTSLIAFFAVFILLVAAFRMWVAPVLGILNLLIGVVWAVGLAALTVGTLNIMTSMMAVILIGLGIDFSIHIISAFTENRSIGLSIKESLEQALQKTGKGVITGALTTAVAFLALLISSSRGMKEMGIVTGGGLLAIMAATFVCLPALLVIRERRREKREKIITQKDISLRSLGIIGSFIGKYYKAGIVFSILITVLLLSFGRKITFDQNYLNMEPKGLLSIDLQDVVLDKFDLSMDYAMLLADSIDESRQVSEELKELPSVASIEDISRYLPSYIQQQNRMPYVKEIKKTISSSTPEKTIDRNDMALLISEIKRLEMNVMELQDLAYIGGQDKVDRKCSLITGNPDDPGSENIINNLLNKINSAPESARKELSKLQAIFAPYFKRTVADMSSEEIITIEELPESIIERYSNKDRSKFLATVFPAGNIWEDMEFLSRFSDDIEKVSDKSTGMPVIFRALIDIIGKDGRNALALTLVLVFILLWIDFKSPVNAIVAMVPLLAGVLWMLGLMKLAGMQLTVMNVMGFPLIVGIGIDDGVHIVHRWKIEGSGSLFKIFSSTGKAIYLTSLTTMLAFGSLIFSIWRGFASLGAAMFIGVGACFLTTILLLSTVIGALDKGKNL